MGGGRHGVAQRWRVLALAALWLPVARGQPEDRGQQKDESAVDEADASPPFGTWWFKGNPKYKFRQNRTRVHWEPKHPQVVLTHFPPESLSKVGDTVVKKFGWMSTGLNKCPAEMYADGPEGRKWQCNMDKCAHRSVSCLTGTGDFRIGLFDSQAEGTAHITGHGFANATSYGGVCEQLRHPPFSQYRGYHWRLYPHLSAVATKYTHPKTGGHVPCGFYFKGNTTSLYSKQRLDHSGHGCFQLGLGEWSVLTLSLERISETVVEMGMEMNGFAYTETHDVSNRHWARDADLVPEAIDTMVVMYPNGRRYYEIEWEYPGTHPDSYKEPPAPEADYDYDEEAAYGHEDEIDEQTELVGKWHHETASAFLLSPMGLLEWLLGVQLFSKGLDDFYLAVSLAGFTLFLIGLLMRYGTGELEEAAMHPDLKDNKVSLRDDDEVGAKTPIPSGI